MSEERTLRVFVGDTSFIFVESINATPTELFDIILTDNTGSQTSPDVFSLSIDQLSSIIQNTLRHQEIHADSINLSLPTKDIIFRSFVIPWIPSGELRSAINFEASKYIPFNISELSFTFHPIYFNDGNTRFIRIIFVAIKKEILSKYAKIFEDAGLSVNLIEPCTLSLLRIVLKQNLMPVDKAVAIVEHSDSTGKIIICDKALPYFVREFTLSSVQENESAPDNVYIKKLINETRISIDYFNRQNEQINIEEILFISNNNSKEYLDCLRSEFDYTFGHINYKTLLDAQKSSDVQYIYAFGTTVLGGDLESSDFNLNRRKPRKAPQRSIPDFRNKIDVKQLILAIIISVGIFGVIFGLTTLMQMNIKKNVAELKDQLGVYEGANKDTLTGTISLYEDKIKHLEHIRKSSFISGFFDKLPKYLPDGVWIEKINITYKDSPLEKSRLKEVTDLNEHVKPKMEITGYAYLENIKEQFMLVNDTVRNLKTDEHIRSQFSNIVIDKATTQNLDELSLTSFKIICR